MQGAVTVVTASRSPVGCDRDSPYPVI